MKYTLAPLTAAGGGPPEPAVRRLLGLVKWIVQASCSAPGGAGDASSGRNPTFGDVSRRFTSTGRSRHLLTSPSGAPPAVPPKPVMDLLGYCCLMEDLMEIGTIGDCEELFACMEADIEVWGMEPDNIVRALHDAMDPP